MTTSLFMFRTYVKRARKAFILVALLFNVVLIAPVSSVPHQLQADDIEKLTLELAGTSEETPLLEEESAFTQAPWVEAEQVVLQGLDKTTARVFTVKAKINQLIKFGTLDIYIRKAYKAPPEDPPEFVGFLEIFERKTGEQPKYVFSGWMFASNPSLFPLEHPVYDVWIKEAKVAEQQANSSPGGHKTKVSPIENSSKQELGEQEGELEEGWEEGW